VSSQVDRKPSDPRQSAQPRGHIKRALRNRLDALAAHAPVELVGPRGVGKRTLARHHRHGPIRTAEQRPPALDAKTHRIRVHPLTVQELGLTTPRDFDTLLQRGGFPAELWFDRPSSALPGHLIGLFSDLSALSGPFAADGARELWAGLMASVGRPLSVRALARALMADERRVGKSVDMLDTHHALFRLNPLPALADGPRFRALKKGQKHYPYDWSQPHHHHGQIEALVGNHLLQWVESGRDWGERDHSLMYFRDCDQREVDFVVVSGETPTWLIQVDPLADAPNRDLAYLARKFPKAQAWHLSVNGPLTPRTEKGITMAHPLPFLASLT